MALANFESREAKAKNQLCQLQERIILLEVDVAKGKLHNEHLEQQRRQGIMELQVETNDQKIRGEAEKYAEIGNGAHKVVQEAREEINFWKERFIKLAWLANQAIMDIPRSLRIAEWMVNPLNTPAEIINPRKAKWLTSQH
ncbi:hypothetical protein CR513_45380, partial [Mucuna pruriens]